MRPGKLLVVPVVGMGVVWVAVISVMWGFLVVFSAPVVVTGVT